MLRTATLKHHVQKWSNYLANLFFHVFKQPIKIHTEDSFRGSAGRTDTALLSKWNKTNSKQHLQSSGGPHVYSSCIHCKLVLSVNVYKHACALNYFPTEWASIETIEYSRLFALLWAAAARSTQSDMLLLEMSFISD